MRAPLVEAPRLERAEQRPVEHLHLGHAAQVIVMHCLMQPGDEFVAAKKLYGGSINQFNHAFKNFNWNVVWADTDDIGSF